HLLKKVSGASASCASYLLFISCPPIPSPLTGDTPIGRASGQHDPHFQLISSQFYAASFPSIPAAPPIAFPILFPFSILLWSIEQFEHCRSTSRVSYPSHPIPHLRSARLPLSFDAFHFDQFFLSSPIPLGISSFRCS